MIRELAPTADFTDPAWGALVTPDFVIEFNMGRDEVVDSMMLHVRGGGSAVAFIDALLTHLQRDGIRREFRAWQAYRDSVIEQP